MVQQRALVLSAFPGTGKTTLFETVEGFKKPDSSEKPSYIPVILDSDSSKFSWIRPGERHPDFPNNYIEHIKENLATADVILTSTHKVVRDALREAGINFTIVFPLTNCKEHYLQRYIDRGSPESFVNLMDNNWDNFIAELEEDPNPEKLRLVENHFIKDLMIIE